MAVACGLAIDRVAQSESLFEGIGGHVDAWHVCHYGCDLGVGEFYLGCAVGVDAEADRLSFADGVGDLHEDTVSHSCGHKVLCYVAGGIGCRAVYLGGVFALE